MKKSCGSQSDRIRLINPPLYTTSTLYDLIDTTVKHGTCPSFPWYEHNGIRKSFNSRGIAVYTKTSRYIYHEEISNVYPTVHIF